MKKRHAKGVSLRDFLRHCKRIAKKCYPLLFALQKLTALLTKYSELYFYITNLKVVFSLHQILLAL